MYIIGENESRLMRLDNEYYTWYYNNIGRPPSFWDEEYPLGFEVSDNGTIMVRELTEEERMKRNALSERIDRYNKARDFWIVREAYKRYGYEVAEWMARVRKVEIPDDFYPCHCKEA